MKPVQQTRLQSIFDTVYRHLLTQKRQARGAANTTGCQYLTKGGLRCAVGCLIPLDRYNPAFEGDRVECNQAIALAADLQTPEEIHLASTLQNVHDSTDVALWKQELANVAKEFDLSIPSLDNPIQTLHRTRLERLVSLSSNGSICIETVARLLDCPEASIRRDIFTLRQQGYYITLEDKQIRNHGKRTALIAPQGDQHV